MYFMLYIVRSGWCSKTADRGWSTVMFTLWSGECGLWLSISNFAAEGHLSKMKKNCSNLSHYCEIPFWPPTQERTEIIEFMGKHCISIAATQDTKLYINWFLNFYVTTYSKKGTLLTLVEATTTWNWRGRPEALAPYIQSRNVKLEIFNLHIPPISSCPVY